MLSNDDHPGLFAFMVGVIVVVMTAVGLSLLMDRKFSFSRSANALQNVIKSHAEEIELLKAHIRESSGDLAESDPKRRQAAAGLESFQRQVVGDSQRLKSLNETREGLRKAIPAITGEYAKYRAKYREQTWLGAVGESLGTLTLRGGREYLQAVITKVTDVGLEIRHADGIARIQAPDLDQSFQDRFQWNDEERRARLKEEQDELTPPLKPKDARPIPPVRPAGRESARRPEPPNPDTARIEALRGKVIAWKSKVSQISTELSQARSSSYGSQSSVPGSLETWQAKSNRLASELARAKAGLAAAKASLASVSPNDSLLRPDPSGE